MLNLLIKEDRHWLRKEYFLRLFLVVLMLLVLFSAIWSVVLTSFYLQIKTELDISANELQNIKNSTDVKNIGLLNELNESVGIKISQFEILNFEHSDILDKVVSIRQIGVDVDLISIDLNKNEGNVFASIEIRGLADTRDNLVEYQEKLKQADILESAEIPFSSFAKNSNISFSASIKTVELNNYFENEN